MPRWLEAFAEHRSVANACRAVQLGRTNVYAARKADKVFADAWDEVLETTRDDLEASAMRRAIEGWEEPVIYKGRLCEDKDGEPLVVRKFSNALTIFMLKTNRPGTYNIAPGDTGSGADAEQRAADVRDAVRMMLASLAESELEQAAEVEDGDGE